MIRCIMYSKCHKRCFCYFYGFQTNNVIQNSHIVFGCSHNNICFIAIFADLKTNSSSRKFFELVLSVMF